MCIMIHKTKGKKLKESLYEECFRMDPDGAGIAYVEDNEIKTITGLMTKEEAVSTIKRLEENELVVHFRRASPGMMVSKENTHPFVIKLKEYPEYSYAFAHNGRFDWNSTKEKSDTRFFVEDFLTPLLERDPWFFNLKNNRLMFEGYIGRNNKLIVMCHDSKENETEIHILNKKQGENDKGCWFSNRDYVVRKYVQSDWSGFPCWSGIEGTTWVNGVPVGNNVLPSRGKDQKPYVLTSADAATQERSEALATLKKEEPNPANWKVGDSLYGAAIDFSHLSADERTKLGNLCHAWVAAYGLRGSLSYSDKVELAIIEMAQLQPWIESMTWAEAHRWILRNEGRAREILWSQIGTPI